MISRHSATRSGAAAPPGIALASSLVLLVAIHWTTVRSLVQTWSRDPFSHAYFVVAASAYLAWSSREQLAAVSLRPSLIALPVLGLLGGVWVLGRVTNTNLLMELCLVPMCITLIWAVVGTAAARVLAFPLGLLLFAVPLGEVLAPALQQVTARVAVQMLALTHLGPVLEGYVITIADKRWLVRESCGGINYLVASLVVGYLYAGLAYRSWGHRAAVMGAAAVVPLVGNVFRVYTMILLDHLGATRLVSGMEHHLYGVLVFTLCMIVLFVICGSWRESPVTGRDVTSLAQPGLPTVSPTSPWRTALCAGLAVLMVALGPWSASALSVTPAPRGVTMRASLPDVSLPWRAVDGNLLSWCPRFVTPAVEVLQAYEAGDTVVQLYAARYDASRSGVELASSGNHLYDDAWWSAGGGRRRIVLDGQSFEVNETLLRSSSHAPLVMWNWYRIDDTFTRHDVAAKLLLARARLFRRAVGAADAYAVATEEQLGRDPAAVFSAFLQHVSLSNSGRRTVQTSPQAR